MKPSCSNKNCKEPNKPRNKENFGPDKRLKDGFQSQCRVCQSWHYKRNPEKYKRNKRSWTANPENRELQKETRKKWNDANIEKAREMRKEWEDKNKIKMKAHWAVRSAIKKGKLVRPYTCEKCGSIEPIQAHHDDYSKPLEVRWLCQPCHRKRHIEIDGDNKNE